MILKEQKNTQKQNYNKEEYFIFINKNRKIQVVSKLFQEYFTLDIT